MDIPPRPPTQPSSQVTASVLPPCEAARHVNKRVAYYNIDSCPYPVYAVDTARRHTLIPKEFRSELRRHPQPWTVYQYKLHDRSVTPENAAASMKSATKLEVPDPHSGQALRTASFLPFPAPEDKTDKEESVPFWAYNWQSGSTKGNNCRLPLTNLQKNSLLAIYNSDTTATLQVQTGAATIAVPPEQGAVFKVQEDDCWTRVAEYYAENVQHFHTNPLMHDHGPMLDTDRKTTPYSGEYFLLPHMVQDLATHHSATHSRPQLCQSETEVHEAIRSLPQGTPVSLLLQHDSSPHMAAVLLLKTDDNRLIAYVHKTLEPDNPLEQDMLHMVCDAMTSAEGFQSSFLLTPGYKLQQDFSSCSTYALDALIVFANAPGLFSRWLEEEVMRGKNTFIVAQNYADQYSSRNKPAPLTDQELERYRQEMLTRAEADPDFDHDDRSVMMVLYSQIIADRPITKTMKVSDLNFHPEHQLNIFYTEAHHTPTALLRLMQANTHELDSRMDDVIDDHGTTLRQYRQHHTHEVPNHFDPENGATKKTFLGALCERYSSINEWAVLKREGKVFPPPLRSKKCADANKQTGIHFPFRVRHATSLGVATQWFDSNGLTSKPSQTDFDNICDFEEFVSNHPDFNPASALRLHNWISRLMKPRTHRTPREQLLREWIRIPMYNSHYQRKKITSVQRRLRHLHKKSGTYRQLPAVSARSRTRLSTVPSDAKPLIQTVSKIRLKKVTHSETVNPVSKLTPVSETTGKHNGSAPDHRHAHKIACSTSLLNGGKESIIRRP